MKAAVRVHTLLTSDDKYPSTNSLRDAVGDSFLYKNLAIFRKVRDTVVSLGYQFCCADTSL